MKKTKYNLLVLALAIFAFQNCDQIKDDAVPEIKLSEAFYTKPDLPVLVRLDKSLLEKTLDISGGSGNFELLNDGFLLYHPTSLDIQHIRTSDLFCTD